ncbi:PH domain-containing protein [Metabacillus arenae]|uniref:PH domain-containing protein n=1 Tax=Metabacillus arenae TaxID=2771434 RepID=A0A926NK97_9BACI|nr:PH domain-containing protein [Metabacillus arenae]MBD1382153.1 PH domain-containing protein [Metabacillus arenae]
MMSNQKRLHFASVLLNFFKQLKDFLIPMLIFFFVNMANDMKSYSFYSFIAFGVILLAFIVISIMKWMKFTYRIEEDEFRIEQGVIVTSKRYVPIERIQTINVSAGIIQQLFGLVKLQVETAGGAHEAEIVLGAIRKDEADKIREHINERKQLLKTVQTHEEDVQKEMINTEPDLTYKMTKKELIIAASTSSGIGVILSAGAALFSQVDDIIPYEKIFDQFASFISASVTVYAILVAVGLLLAWVLSIAGMMLKYASFTVIKKDEEIVISRGLLEKNQVTVPIKRIQAIKIKENPIRQMLGFVTVHLVSAGGGSKDKDVSTLLFPVVKKTKATDLIKQFLPEYTNQSTLNPLPKRALKRYLFRCVVPGILISIPFSIFLFPWGLFSLLLIPIGILLGYRGYKDAGWAIKEKQLQLTYRTFSKTTFLVHKRRVQSLEVKSSFFQKRSNLGTVKTSTISAFLGEHHQLVDLEREHAEEIYGWYSYEQKS